MGKSIVLLERYNYDNVNLLKSVLQDTDYIIELLVVGTADEKKQYMHHPRIKRVYARDTGDLWKVDAIDKIDYEVIQNYKDIQSDYESGTSRYVSDYNLRKKMYYNSLFFWYEFFKNHTIDMVIVKGLNHGMADDCIAIAISQSMKIPCYQIEDVLSNKIIVVDNLINQLIPGKRKHVLRSTSKYRKINVDTGGMYFPKSSLKAFLAKSIYHYFGYLAVYAIQSFVHWHFSDRYMDIPGSEYTLLDSIKAFYKVKKTERYISRKAVLPNLQVPYIIYYLHFEPEASIQVRCTLQSQLVAIAMLSKALPKGWKLYVKEHPHQWLLNTARFSYHLRGVPNFKNERFYQDILQYKNVVLVSSDASSKLLTENARCIASFNGTVGVEAVADQKPVILFGSERTIFKYHKDFLCISSYADCQRAMEKIQNGWKPLYHDFEKTAMMYLYDRTEEAYGEALADLCVYNDAKAIGENAFGGETDNE